MKTGIIKLLGACAAAFALAQPASATVTIGLQVVGQDLQVFANRGSDVITAFDIGINFNNALLGNILGASDSGLLGDTGAFDALFGFNAAAGLMEGDEVSFLTNAQVAGLQTTDPITLFTVHFDGAADLSTGNFSLVPFDGVKYVVDCASGAAGTVVCVPGAVTAVPEPTSMALVTLGLAVVGLRNRRRLGLKAAPAAA